MFYYNLSHRISWAGIFAGLIIAIVAFGALMALGVIIGSIINLDFTGTGIMAIIWSMLSVVGSAYVAGMAAMFSTKGSLNDSVVTSPVVSNWYDANMVGLLTGCMIVIATTYLTFSGVSGVFTGVAKVAGGVANTVGDTVTTVVGTSIASSDASQIISMINQVDQSEIEQFVSDNVEDLDQQQIRAAAQVVGNLIDTTQNQLQNQNTYDIDALQNYADQRLNEIQNLLRSPELISRLQSQGLTQSQAVEVQNELQQYVVQLKAQYNQTVNSIDRTIEDIEDKTRTATALAALLWLVASALTIFSAIWGSQAVYTYNSLDEREVRRGK